MAFDRSTNEISRTEQLKLEKCEDLFMIGELSEYATKVTSTGNIQIFINPLCDDPKPISDSGITSETGERYIGFDNNQSRAMLPQFYDFDSYDYDEKQDELIEYYREKIIVFHPRFARSNINGKWYKNFVISNLIDRTPEQGSYYYSVPRVQMEVGKFEQLLKKGEYFDIDRFDGEVNDEPSVILCGQYAYKLKNDSLDLYLLECNVNDPTRWPCINFDDLVKIDVSKLPDYKTSIIRASDTVSFIEANLWSAINVCKDFEPFEGERNVVKETPKITVLPEETVSEIENLDRENAELGNSEENQFIDGLKQLTMDNGLQYKRKDLINFHISVKTNPLTILAGMSGTGKSRLAMNYAKMLDLSEDNNTLLFMPISPAYTEPSDVLGYLNSINGLYIPSETGLVQFLIHAETNPDQMHMVIFDEMNLSQVEYWFSPFISILEKDMGDRRLKLYDEDARCINEKVYPPTIKIGENVIFIGTVNIDDTTKNFSDRLLDRTFVINLDMVSFGEFYKDYLKHKSSGDKMDVARVKPKNVSQFISWCHGTDRDYMKAFENHTEELDFFDEMNAIIKKYIPDGGISHRVLKNIGNYILNVPRNGDDMIISRQEVLDMVITQTIMTKIRGTETQLQELVGIVNDEGKLQDSEFTNLLDKYKNISEFELTKQKLRTKAEELKVNGYTN